MYHIVKKISISYCVTASDTGQKHDTQNVQKNKNFRFGTQEISQDKASPIRDTQQEGQRQSGTEGSGDKDFTHTKGGTHQCRAGDTLRQEVRCLEWGGYIKIKQEIMIIRN